MCGKLRSVTFLYSHFYIKLWIYNLESVFLGSNSNYARSMEYTLRMDKQNVSSLFHTPGTNVRVLCKHPRR